jgi:cation transport ATPase
VCVCGRSLALKKLMEHQPSTAILLSTSAPSTGSTGSTGTETESGCGSGYRVLSERVVSTDLLQEGDLVKVVRGMVIPADGEAVHGEGEVNEALITGEAVSQ